MQFMSLTRAFGYRAPWHARDRRKTAPRLARRACGAARRAADRVDTRRLRPLPLQRGPVRRRRETTRDGRHPAPSRRPDLPQDPAIRSVEGWMLGSTRAARSFGHGHPLRRHCNRPRRADENTDAIVRVVSATIGAAPKATAVGRGVRRSRKGILRCRCAQGVEQPIETAEASATIKPTRRERPATRWHRLRGPYAFARAKALEELVWCRAVRYALELGSDVIGQRDGLASCAGRSAFGAPHPERYGPVSRCPCHQDFHTQRVTHWPAFRHAMAPLNHVRRKELRDPRARLAGRTHPRMPPGPMIDTTS